MPNDLINKLIYCTNEAEQLALIQGIKERSENSLPMLSQVLEINPFLTLPSDDRRRLIEIEKCETAKKSLLLLRQIAKNVSGRRYCVFCMPKSGSSFVQSAISAATGFPNILLTHFTQPSISTHFGMTAREQEFDEFAIIYSIFNTGGNFVTQHHTCATRFLASQLSFFNIQPILTIRNIFDCIVSADDMYFESFKTLNKNSFPETLFTLPSHFATLETEQRLSLLSYSFGLWLIHFYISWKRLISAGYINPLPIIYENDIVTKQAANKLSQFLQLNDEENTKLQAHIENFDKTKARFNKGVAGRGQAIPEDLKHMLRSYAANFKELSEQDLFLLFDNHGPGH